MIYYTINYHYHWLVLVLVLTMIVLMVRVAHFFPKPIYGFTGTVLVLGYFRYGFTVTVLIFKYYYLKVRFTVLTKTITVKPYLKPYHTIFFYMCR